MNQTFIDLKALEELSKLAMMKVNLMDPQNKTQKPSLWSRLNKTRNLPGHDISVPGTAVSGIGKSIGLTSKVLGGPMNMLMMGGPALGVGKQMWKAFPDPKALSMKEKPLVWNQTM